MDYHREAVAHSLIWAITVLGIFTMIAFGVSSCSEGEMRLRSDCIKAGGTVVPTGEKSACIILGPTKQ